MVLLGMVHLEASKLWRGEQEKAERCLKLTSATTTTRASLPVLHPSRYLGPKPSPHPMCPESLQHHTPHMTIAVSLILRQMQNPITTPPSVTVSVQSTIPFKLLKLTFDKNQCEINSRAPQKCDTLSQSHYWTFLLELS